MTTSNHGAIPTVRSVAKCRVIPQDERGFVDITSGVNSYVAVDSRLAGQDVPFGFVLLGERVLHVHCDVSRKEFDSA